MGRRTPETEIGTAAMSPAEAKKIRNAYRKRRERAKKKNEMKRN